MNIQLEAILVISFLIKLDRISDIKCCGGRNVRSFRFFLPEMSLEHLLCFSHCVVVVQSLTCVPTLCDPTDCVARQAPLSMGFPRQEYQNGLPLLSLGIFPTQGSNSRLLHSGASFTTEPPGKPLDCYSWYLSQIRYSP